ncbi:hypothetical protein BD311DRAFT_417908 [Dichomitus squalens]|uniref:Uncharacterized protein n=1 Tax=Dichomitus squalens TaxID=114155 RepID=A0A4Q9MHK3_9APHY|nr:hypothetical protein BD311DRAFT_417908 [Dichomitus squalens]
MLCRRKRSKLRWRGNALKARWRNSARSIRRRWPSSKVSSGRRQKPRVTFGTLKRNSRSGTLYALYCTYVTDKGALDCPESNSEPPRESLSLACEG